jgi:hypothetical protein
VIKIRTIASVSEKGEGTRGMKTSYNFWSLVKKMNRRLRGGNDRWWW